MSLIRSHKQYLMQSTVGMQAIKKRIKYNSEYEHKPKLIKNYRPHKMGVA